MKKTLQILVLVAFFGASLFGQDSVLLTKNFPFKDGVYLSFAELQSNRPAFALSAVEMQSFTNPQTSLTQVTGIVLKDSRTPLPLDSVWAICLDGVPSLRVPGTEINRDEPNFAALKLRGKICYFTYPDYRSKKVRVAAYNPLTGRPYREGTVEREEEVFVEKMLRFQTGEVADFNPKNLLDWIQDDPLLVETVMELPHEEQHEKLFKALLIYVDRNAVYLNLNE